MIRRDAILDAPYLVMNSLAAMIASYALLADSGSGVIGAMLVAMLLGPITGIGLSLVDGDFTLLRNAFIALASGVLVVVACSLLIGLIHPEIPAGKELLGRTNPNYLDMMIALAGGAVGACAALTPRISNAVVGVAIATALVPPLCTGSIFLARGEFENAAGGYLLAFANIVAIQFASSAVLWLVGFQKAAQHLHVKSKVLWLNVLSLSLVAVLFLVLGYNTKILLSRVLYEANVRKALVSGLQPFSEAYLDIVRIDKEDGATLVRALVRSPYGFTAEEVKALEDKLPLPTDQTELQLRLRRVAVTVMSRKGPLFDAEAANVSSGETLSSSQPP